MNSSSNREHTTTESGRGVFVTETGNFDDAVLPGRIAKKLAKGWAIRFLRRALLVL
jgi:hypothetical protein